MTPQSSPSQPNTNEQQWRAEKRKNWKRQLYPQWALVVVSFFALVGAIITVCILREELLRSHRPWVTLIAAPEATSPLTFDADGAHVKVRFSLRNGGTSVAIGTSTQHRLYVGPREPLRNKVYNEAMNSCDPTAPVNKVVTEVVGLLILPQTTEPPDAFSTVGQCQ